MDLRRAVASAYAYVVGPKGPELRELERQELERLRAESAEQRWQIEALAMRAATLDSEKKNLEKANKELEKEKKHLEQEKKDLRREMDRRLKDVVDRTPECLVPFIRRPSEKPPLQALQEQIKRVRNEMYLEGRMGWCSKLYETVLFARILYPMLEHGSAGIFAPDEAIQKLCGAVWRRLSGRGQGSSAGTGRRLCDGARERPLFCLVVVLSLVAFKLYAKQLLCFFKTTLLGWALYNRTLAPGQRYLSISAMMIVRLAVSNALPFTSPAFAFLIGASQPEGQEWMGTLYLLGCSMPAGLIVPFCDWLLYWLYRPFRSAYQRRADSARRVWRAGGEGQLLQTLLDEEEQGGDLDQFDHHFRATLLCAKVTDHLPFSFWVRPMFMEPAFQAISGGLGAEEKSAAAGAVLAGHFMIWAGPATTMYQRLFVPDWVTCVLIQPLGLAEDVAVVLAAWAASSRRNEFSAEISLYFFMMYMNVANLVTTCAQHGSPGRARILQHLIVLLLTAAAAMARLVAAQGPTDLLLPARSTTMTTTLRGSSGDSACGGPAVHSDLKAAGVLLAWVSLLAVAFRLVARALTSRCSALRSGPQTPGAGCRCARPLLLAAALALGWLCSAALAWRAGGRSA